MQVKWLRRALENLEAEAKYIALDNPAAASKVVETLLNAAAHLSKNPALGRPGRVPGTRELIIANLPYLLPYRVRNETVQILRVFHTSRESPARW